MRQAAKANAEQEALRQREEAQRLAQVTITHYYTRSHMIAPDCSWLLSAAQQLAQVTASRLPCPLMHSRSLASLPSDSQEQDLSEEAAAMIIQQRLRKRAHRKRLLADSAYYAGGGIFYSKQQMRTKFSDEYHGAKRLVNEQRKKDQQEEKRHMHLQKVLDQADVEDAVVEAKMSQAAYIDARRLEARQAAEATRQQRQASASNWPHAGRPPAQPPCGRPGSSAASAAVGVAPISAQTCGSHSGSASKLLGGVSGAFAKVGSNFEDAIGRGLPRSLERATSTFEGLQDNGHGAGVGPMPSALRTRPATDADGRAAASLY